MNEIQWMSHWSKEFIPVNSHARTCVYLWITERKNLSSEGASPQTPQFLVLHIAVWSSRPALNRVGRLFEFPSCSCLSCTSHLTGHILLVVIHKYRIQVFTNEFIFKLFMQNELWPPLNFCTGMLETGNDKSISDAQWTAWKRPSSASCTIEPTWRCYQIA